MFLHHQDEPVRCVSSYFSRILPYVEALGGVWGKSYHLDVCLYIWRQEPNHMAHTSAGIDVTLSCNYDEFTTTLAGLVPPWLQYWLWAVPKSLEIYIWRPKLG